LLSDSEAAMKAVEHRSSAPAELRRSILKAAFEGRLEPQDPNDEPASALLERIKAQSSAAESTKTKNTKIRKAAAK
jgi:type I restriction enzyme S subunit